MALEESSWWVHCSKQPSPYISQMLCRTIQDATISEILFRLQSILFNKHLHLLSWPQRVKPKPSTKTKTLIIIMIIAPKRGARPRPNFCACVYSVTASTSLSDRRYPYPIPAWKHRHKGVKVVTTLTPESIFPLCFVYRDKN